MPIYERPEDWSVISGVLRPTPERVATAKAWLAERIRAGENIRAQSAAEFAAGQGATHPGALRDPGMDDPARQSELISFWQWELAGREAIHDFHRHGFIVPRVTGVGDRPLTMNADGPRIPIGPPGTPVSRPPEFRTTPLYQEYEVAAIGHAELEHRLELYDADLYLTRANLAVFDDRVRRCVEEALACFRNDLFLAAANMLGAASEAAWHQVARAMIDGDLAGAALREETSKAIPSIARIQQHVVKDLQSLDRDAFRARFKFEGSSLDAVAVIARFWRDLRNYGMHPAGTLAPDAFTEAGLGVELMGATSYFEKLALVLQGA